MCQTLGIENNLQKRERRYPWELDAKGRWYFVTSLTLSGVYKSYYQVDSTEWHQPNGNSDTVIAVTMSQADLKEFYTH